jgi:hypothetical protein
MRKHSRSPRLGNGAILPALVVAVLVFASCAAAAKPQPRTPVPGASELTRAESAIRDLFKKEYASEEADDQLALSRKLLEQGLDATNDLASRYVLLREARDLAAKAGDLKRAWRAVDEMAKVFEVNVPALKLPALQVAVAATHSQTGSQNLVVLALPLVEAALALDDFDTADKLLQAADTAARKSKSIARLRSVAAVAARADTRRKEWARYRQALEVLARAPKDADANLTAGMYRCFYKEDWASGLPRLAQGRDAALKALAEQSLKEADDPQVLADIAGAWWQAAEKLADQERDAIRRYSAERYREALPHLKGLKKELAEKRIAEGGKVTERRYTLIPLIDTNKDAVYGTWRIDKNELCCDHGNFVPRIQIPYRPPEEYDFVVRFSQPQLRNGINLIMPNKHGGTFFWTVSSEGGRSYCLSINGSNDQTRLPADSVIRPHTVHTTVVQVRRDGVKGYLDGVLIHQYKTDFRDLRVDHWRETKDQSVLAVACDDPTVFHAIQIVEVTGSGGRTR